MNQEKLILFVYYSLEDKVLEKIPASLHEFVQIFTCGLDDLEWNIEASYKIVFIPSEMSADPFSPTDDVQNLFQSGRARLVVCGDDAGFCAPVPFTNIPDSVDGFFSACLWAHVCRFPGWGLSSVLPEKAQVWTERLHHERQFVTKIEQAAAFITQQQPSFQNHLMRFRLAALSAATLAFSHGKMKSSKRPAVLQVGLAPNFVVLSLRWSTDTTWEFWQSPSLVAQAMLSCSQISILQLNNETKESELFLAFSADQPSAGSMTPTAIDIISNVRLLSGIGLIRATTDLSFETFEMIAEENSPAFRPVKMEAA